MQSVITKKKKKKINLFEYQVLLLEMLHNICYMAWI